MIMTPQGLSIYPRLLVIVVVVVDVIIFSRARHWGR